MKLKDARDKKKYTDYITKYCPCCGDTFYSTLIRVRFCEVKCYGAYYSLLQYDLHAMFFKQFNLPVHRRWALIAKEKLEICFAGDLHDINNIIDIVPEDEIEEALESLNYPPILKEDFERKKHLIIIILEC